MEYFQLRKNARQVIRIFRGPYEGYDITRLQIWYRESDGTEYKPGRAVAFGSEALPGVIEGLLEMAAKAPKIPISQPSSASDLAEELYGILNAHRQPLHWEILSNIMSKEHPDIGASKWAVYNCLLENSARFDQVEEDVFAVR